MPILTHTDLLIDADAVLRGQGANPEAIRAHLPPRLISLIEGWLPAISTLKANINGWL